MAQKLNRREAVTLLGGWAAMGFTLQAGGPAGAARGAASYAVSEADLFAALDDTANPALGPACAAWKAGNAAKARKALADYLRTRTSVPWEVLPRVADRSQVRWSRDAAERARRGEVTVVAIPHPVPGGRIDWHFDATGGASGLPQNNEWIWQLNRMAWWGDLVRAYQATGDETWAATWVAQMRDWVTQCPPPEKVQNVPKSTWRTIECGIRMLGIWPQAYHAFLLSPSFTEDDLVTYVRTMVAHARYLSAFPSTGNWLTMEMNGLYNVACLFPELKEAAGWRKQAADALYKEQTTQFLPDGAQIELTPGYHNVALDNILGLYKRARTVGREGELPADYAARMEKAFDFNLYLMTPDRSLPRFNDSWPYGVVSRMQRDGVPLFPKREDYRWIATDGKQGKPPAQTSVAFDYAGYYVMRDGWGRDACMGVLDAGPLGYGHYHQDKLNVVVWAYGREVLFDGGGGSYERSPYRSFATDTFGHNCVLVDGKPQRRSTKDLKTRVSDAPIEAHWKSTPEWDYAEGTYRDGYGTETDRIATHTRRLLFLKPTASTPALWIVADTLTPGDAAEHTYQARWHLLTTKTQTDTTGMTTLTQDEGQPNLCLVPLHTAGLQVRSASAQTEPELLGWNVRKDMDPQYVPATTVLHTRTGTGVQRFLTVLVPLRAGESNPVVGVERISPTEAVVTLRSGKGVRVKTSDVPGSAGLSVQITG